MKREKTGYPGVYKRGKNSFSYKMRNTSGKVVEVSGFTSVKKALDAKVEAQAAKRAGSYTPGNMTFQQLYEMYYNSRKNRIDEDSLSNIEMAARKYILPQLANIKLHKLIPEHIEDLMNDVAEKCSKKRANAMREHVSTILNYGIRHRKLTFNWAKSVEPFKVPKPKFVVFTDEEYERLMSVSPLRERVIISIARYAGLRRREIFGLRWCDIDFKNGFLHVERQLKRGKEKPPKSEAGVRSIPIRTELQEILQEWAKHTLEKGRTDWLFTTHRGKRLQAEEWAKSTFKDLCAEAGLGNRNLHWLRDTFATEQAEHGTDPGFTQGFMGHANFNTTYTRYFNPRDEQKKKVMERFEEKKWGKSGASGK